MVLLTWTHPYIPFFDMDSLILSFDSVTEINKGNVSCLSKLYGYAQAGTRAIALDIRLCSRGRREARYFLGRF
jgi:hypothetical protein